MKIKSNTTNNNLPWPIMCLVGRYTLLYLSICLLAS